MRFVLIAMLGLTLLAAPCICVQEPVGSKVCLYRLSVAYDCDNEFIVAEEDDLEEFDRFDDPGVPGGETVLTL